MGKKAVNTYPFALMSLCDCYKTQKICEKAFYNCSFFLECLSNCYKIPETC